jgi:hypothetical protein
MYILAVMLSGPGGTITLYRHGCVSFLNSPYPDTRPSAASSGEQSACTLQWFTEIQGTLVNS